jgi:hypothetical protein
MLPNTGRSAAELRASGSVVADALAAICATVLGASICAWLTRAAPRD